jgi:hypothetical protein
MKTNNKLRFFLLGLFFSAVLMIPVSVHSAGLTTMTQGAWAEYVTARSIADLIGTGFAAGGGLFSHLSEQAWIVDRAKVPLLSAETVFKSTNNGIVNGYAEQASFAAKAQATSTANTNGAMHVEFSAQYGGVADAWAGVGKQYKHDGSSLKNRIFAKVYEMTIDPLPPPPSDIAGSLVGTGVPVAAQMSIDLQFPNSSEWQSIFNATFSLQWNPIGNFWDLNIDDITGQFSNADFTKSTQMVDFGSLGFLPTTVWTLNSEKEFYADFWTTDNLLESGTPWEAGALYGTQLQLLSQGVTATAEPTTMLLLGLGLMGLAGVRRKMDK